MINYLLLIIFKEGIIETSVSTQVSMTSPKYTSVLKGLHNAIALDFHYKRSSIYWSDVSMDVIRKVFVNGTGAEGTLNPVFFPIILI